MRKNLTYYGAAAIGVVTFLVYLTSLKNGYVNWDDEAYVFQNPHIRALDATFFKWAFFDFYISNWHPLTWISHALDYAAWGMNPTGHHLANILLHAGNAALVAILAARLIEASREKTGTHERPSFLTEGAVVFAAGVTGLLFGLHPLHVESAAWIAERKDLLCAVFFLLSVLFYLQYVQKAGTHAAWSPRRFRSRHYLAVLLSFILALLSKPMAVTLPLVLLILDWYPLNRINSFRTFLSAAFEKAPLAALTLFSSVVTILAQRDALQSTDFAPVSIRLLVAAKALAWYLFKMVWPVDLIAFYPYPGKIALVSTEALVPVLLVIGITAFCFMPRRHQVWRAAWAYYVVTLIPVLGIVQVGHQEMADRYTYLPSIGPFLIAGLAAGRAWTQTSRAQNPGVFVKFSVPAVCVAVFVFLSVVTVHQIGIWKDSMVLWTHVIETRPQQIPEAYYNRGLIFDRRGQADQAFADYEEAILLDPDFWAPYMNRGLLYFSAGQITRAIADLDRAISLNPGRAEAYYNRAWVYGKLGRLDLALADYDRAIALNPNDPEAYINRGEILNAVGQRDRAMRDFEHAMVLDPAYTQSRLQPQR